MIDILSILSEIVLKVNTMLYSADDKSTLVQVMG